MCIQKHLFNICLKIPTKKITIQEKTYTKTLFYKILQETPKENWYVYFCAVGQTR